MVFITHKVLNQLHSDTIACVLYELLVCRSLGFGIVFRDFPSRLRFHKFQYCSIFKVLLALLSDSSIIISKVVLFVKHFFRYFFELSKRLFKSFPPTRCPVPRCVFAGTSLLFGFWRAAVLRDSLFIIPHFQPLSTPFFDFFYNFLILFLDKVYSVVLAHFLVSIPSPTKNICFWLGVRTAARRVLAWILGRTKKEVWKKLKEILKKVLTLGESVVL